MKHYLKHFRSINTIKSLEKLTWWDCFSCCCCCFFCFCHWCWCFCCCYCCCWCKWCACKQNFKIIEITKEILQGLIQSVFINTVKILLSPWPKTHSALKNKATQSSSGTMMIFVDFYICTFYKFIHFFFFS